MLYFNFFQETYWRIPAHLSLNILKSHSNMICQALEKNLIVTNEDMPEATGEMNDVFSNEDIFEEPAGITRETTAETNESLNEQFDLSNVLPSTSKADNFSSIEPTNVELIAQESGIDFNSKQNPAGRKKRRIVRINDENDSESEMEISQNENADSDREDSLKDNKTFADSDDDIVEGADKENLDTNNVETDITKRYRALSDSDEERPKNKKSRIIESDDED